MKMNVNDIREFHADLIKNVSDSFSKEILENLQELSEISELQIIQHIRSAIENNVGFIGIFITDKGIIEISEMILAETLIKIVSKLLEKKTEQ